MSTLKVKYDERKDRTVVRLGLVGYWIVKERGDTALNNTLASRSLSNATMKLKYHVSLAAELSAGKVSDALREGCGHCLICDRGEE